MELLNTKTSKDLKLLMEVDKKKIKAMEDKLPKLQDQIVKLQNMDKFQTKNLEE